MKQTGGFESLYLACLLVIICLLPILRSGLYSDDIRNFEVASSFKHIPAFKFISSAQHEIDDWKDSGRYTPVAFFLQNFVFDYFNSVSGYKTFVLICNLLAVGSFMFLLFSFGLTGNFIALFVFLYSAEIQFRIQYHDAFTSLNGMYPLLTAIICLSVGFLSRFFGTNKRYYYLPALFSCVVALMFSEEGLILMPLVFVVTLYKGSGWKNKIAAVAPFIFICCIYLGYMYHLHDAGNTRYPGLQPNLDFDGMMNLLQIQLFAALPFSNLYHQVAIPQIFWAQLSDKYDLLELIAILIAGGYFSAIYFRRDAGKMVTGYWYLICIACIFFVVPAMILMPSSKYQSELWMGSGYLPVYLQNFGVALFLTVIAAYLLTRSTRWGKMIFAVLSLTNVAAVVFALLFNSSLIKVMNYNRSLPAEAMCKAVRKGILSSVPEGSEIILSHDFIWQGADAYQIIFRNETGKDFRISDLQLDPRSNYQGGNQLCFLLDCNPGDTIYTKLYSTDCQRAQKGTIIASDTVMNNCVPYKVEEPILRPRP